MWPTRKRASLYGNIIANRAKAPEDYQKYERTIAAFAAEQMRLGHMDDNLAMIYQDVLQREKPTEEQAKAMAELLYYEEGYLSLSGNHEGVSVSEPV